MATVKLDWKWDSWLTVIIPVGTKNNHTNDVKNGKLHSSMLNRHYLLTRHKKKHLSTWSEHFYAYLPFYNIDMNLLHLLDLHLCFFLTILFSYAIRLPQKCIRFASSWCCFLCANAYLLRFWDLQIRLCVIYLNYIERLTCNITTL
jgi:hypothetical protein